MKVNGSYAPKIYEFEIINKGKTALISFYENVREITYKSNDTNAIKGYEFDKYQLSLPYEKRIEDKVKENPLEWLEFAKAKEIEKLSNEVRNRRNELLLETDWTQTLDAPITEENQLEYRSYRQELRDITNKSEFPYIIEWPERPEIIKK